MKNRYIQFTADDFEQLLLKVGPRCYPMLKVFDENDDFCSYIIDDKLLSKVEELHRKEMSRENQNDVMEEFLSVILHSFWDSTSGQMNGSNPQNIEKFEPVLHSFIVKYEKDDDF